MNEKIEDIIKNKSFIELTQQEKDTIKEWVENEETFNQLKLMLLSSAQLLQKEEDELNPTIKQRLNVRFAEKHNRTRLVWYNSLWTFLWPAEASLVRKPLLQLAAIGVVVAFTVPFLIQQNPIEVPLVAKVEVDKRDDDTMRKASEEVVSAIDKNKVKDKVKTIPEARQDEKLDRIDLTAQKHAEMKSATAIDKRLKIDRKDDAQQNKKEVIVEPAEISEDMEVVERENRIEETSVQMLSNPSLSFKQLQGTVSFDSQSINVTEQGLNNLTLKKNEKVDVKETIGLLTALY
jgi:hypothetical protein